MIPYSGNAPLPRLTIDPPDQPNDPTLQPEALPLVLDAPTLVLAAPTLALEAPAQPVDARTKSDRQPPRWLRAMIEEATLSGLDVTLTLIDAGTGVAWDLLDRVGRRRSRFNR